MTDRERNLQHALFFGAIAAMMIGILARTSGVPIPGLALAGGLELWLGWRQITTGRSTMNTFKAGGRHAEWSDAQLERMSPRKRSLHATFMGVLSILFGVALLLGELSFAIPGLFR